MNGKQLRAARKALGLTQAQLAKAMDVARNTIARYERDERAIPRLLELALKTLNPPPAVERPGAARRTHSDKKRSRKSAQKR